jgi:polysaccharide biosynthesis/export protein
VKEPVVRAVWITLFAMCVGSVFSQSLPAQAPGTPTPSARATEQQYVIGPQDVLGVVFWLEDKMTADVVVRPDGKISLPLLNDIQAAGYTPEQLSKVVSKAAAPFLADPIATVIVKQINSRKVFVLGQVARPGTVSLATDMNVLQLLAEVGGFQEYASKNDVIIIRNDNGRERRFRFNYDDVVNGKKPEQNIMLLPGDTMLVR